jgi:hypothetical protein
MPAATATVVAFMPPVYVKDVVAMAAGSDGLTVYFTLADNNGGYTGSAGTVEVAIHDGANKVGGILFDQSFPVKQSDFQEAQVGVGAFAHTVLLCNIGRITHSEFNGNPQQSVGTVTITFTLPNGKTAYSLM